MNDKTAIFEAVRPRLMGLAYRMLGSVSDAQDAVQDTYLKWATYEGPKLHSPAAWLSRVCTNLCLDRLKSAHRVRVDYVGPWIPDQIQTDFDAGPEDRAEIASSLTTAFLLLMERLRPKERAAYLLHDIFGMSFDQVAIALDLQPANCRQLAKRARHFVTQESVRHVPDEPRQSELLAAFQSALETGNTEGLAIALHADATMRADSGGKTLALRDVIESVPDICAFISGVLSPAWTGMRLSVRTINGQLGFVVEDGARLHASVSFSYDPDESLRHIFILRHPDKLSRLSETRGIPASSGALFLH